MERLLLRLSMDSNCFSIRFSRILQRQDGQWVFQMDNESSRWTMGLQDGQGVFKTDNEALRWTSLQDRQFKTDYKSSRWTMSLQDGRVFKTDNEALRQTMGLQDGQWVFKTDNASSRRTMSLQDRQVFKTYNESSRRTRSLEDGQWVLKTDNEPSRRTMSLEDGRVLKTDNESSRRTMSIQDRQWGFVRRTSLQDGQRVFIWLGGYLSAYLFIYWRLIAPSTEKAWFPGTGQSTTKGPSKLTQGPFLCSMEDVFMPLRLSKLKRK